MPLNWPSIDTSRPDFVFYGSSAPEVVSVATIDYEYQATDLITAKVDEGAVYYAGTLIVEVPAGAGGTYTIDFVHDDRNTFMLDGEWFEADPSGPLLLSAAEQLRFVRI